MKKKLFGFSYSKNIANFEAHVTRHFHRAQILKLLDVYSLITKVYISMHFMEHRCILQLLKVDRNIEFRYT